MFELILLSSSLFFHLCISSGILPFWTISLMKSVEYAKGTNIASNNKTKYLKIMYLKFANIHWNITCISGYVEPRAAELENNSVMKDGLWRSKPINSTFYSFFNDIEISD